MSKLSKRKQVLSLLNTMNRVEHGRMSSRIAERLFTTADYSEAKTIGVTVSRFPEVDTRPIIEKAWANGKQVAVPKCIPTTREMDFRLITSFDELETIYMDLLEPDVEKTVSIPKDSIDLQIVPGVVFSDEGYRIGFGGGYYDRYLKNFKGSTISLSLTIQIGHDVHNEEHDIPVDKIISEVAVIECSKLREEK